MFARSTSVQADPTTIDAGIDYIRDEVMPQVMQLEGCTGLSMMVDRDDGFCIVTTGWRDEQALMDTVPTIEPIRRRAVETLGATGAMVEHWEIATMHREHASHEGACVRSVWLRTTPERVDALGSTFRHEALPQIETLPGFCSASMLIDRHGGRAVATYCFESRQAMEQGRDRAQSIRNAASEQLGFEVLQVREFELALAHLRIPEMA